MNIYLVGSLRNTTIPDIGIYFRELGFDVFDDWFAAGPEADDYWQQYETQRGHTYAQALQGYAARHVYEFDKYHLDRADIGILALPSGKSGHLELGYLIGRNRPCYILLDKPPERYDVMYQFAQAVCSSKEEIGEILVSKYFEELN